MYPPASASIGVAAILRATVVSSSLHNSGAMSPLLSAMPKATKANSPVWGAIANWKEEGIEEKLEERGEKSNNDCSVSLKFLDTELFFKCII